MENLEFRAWDKGQMYKMPLTNNFGISRFFGILPDDAVVEQYTGLKDKNGKKIFEGDKLKAQTSKGEHTLTVEWVDHNLHIGFKVYGNDRRFNTQLTRNCVYNMQLEITGHIHEEPKWKKPQN